MKIVVISDTHGNLSRLDEVLKKEGEVDMILHCGDICGDEENLRRRTGVIAVQIVAGNMDFDGYSPAYRLVDLPFKHLAFMTHGHRYGVNYGTEMLEDEAESVAADIALYGHTHVPDIHEKNGIWVMNPGSLAYPRQRDRRSSYGVIEIKDESAPKLKIMYI